MSAKTKKRKKKKRYIGLKIQLVLIALVLIGVAYYFLGGYAQQINEMKAEASQLVSSSTKDTFKSELTTVIYDTNGDVLTQLSLNKETYYVDINEIPPMVAQAMVSIEDKKFYTHKGVDYKAIVRAVVAAIRNKEITQGASTITQQLARTVFLSNDKTWQRKIEELYISLNLEKKYTKDEIMEFYLNNIYFGNGYYGIQAASKGYFSRDINYLSLSEVAFLCAIPNNPTLYDPIDNKENTIKRRDRILKNMYEDGKISKASYQNAINEEIKLDVNDSDEINDYEDTYVTYCAIRQLMQQDGFEFQYDFENDAEREVYDVEYSEKYDECKQQLITGGYEIYTTIDPKIQKKLQKSVNSGLKSFTEKDDEGIYTLQGAAVTIDNTTGYVVAIVGGRSQDTDTYTLNRAYQSFRQPGSSIKPILVYAPAIEELGYTPATIVEDKKIEDGPSNSSGSYEGKMTLREAVAKSKNTVAWQVFDELTPEVGFTYLKGMEFSKIEDEDYRLTAALGGLTDGVSPVEMAAGYATLENDGVFRQATCIRKIIDSDGEEMELIRNSTQIYKKNTARMMTSMLQSVIESGTAKGLDLGDMPSAGKTGTTNDNKDGWFVGYTHYYTTSVWVGYDIPKTLSSLQGATYPGGIWQDFMLKMHENLEPVELSDYVDSSSLSIDDEEDEEEDEEEEDDEEEKQVDETTIDDSTDDSTNREEQQEQQIETPEENEEEPQEGDTGETTIDEGDGGQQLHAPAPVKLGWLDIARYIVGNR